MIQPTSILAYNDIKPKLTAKQDEVFTFLFRVGYPMTNKEIGKAIGRPVNEICPRILELRDAGYVEFAEFKYTPKKSMAWQVANKSESQRELTF